MRRVILVVISSVMIASIQAKALTKEQMNHLTIDSMVVEQIPEESPLKSTVIETQKADTGDKIKAIGVIFDAIVNIGEKIWTIAEKNKPVYGSQNISANAVPEGLTNWQQLTGWQPPRSSSYRVSYVNLYGITVVDFQYTVIFYYGGTLENKGRYVKGATVEVTNLDVAWGYTFNSVVEVPVVANMGSAENPVGGIQMNIHWSVDTILKHSESRSTYFVNGLGSFQALN